jgi:chaperonin GroEL
MLTTDCMVADLPDDKQGGSMGGGDMGGMGGMGGMGMM